MRQGCLILAAAFLCACAPDLSELPADIEYAATTDYEPVGGESADIDVECPPDTFWYDGACRSSDLVVATTGGYDVPFSGRVFVAQGERLDALSELSFPVPLGGPDGTDLSLAVAPDRLMVVGRDGADTVWAYEPARKRFTTLRPPEGVYLNVQDAAWDGARYVVSANQNDALFTFDATGAAAPPLPLGDFSLPGTAPSPAALFIDGGRLSAALQMLGDDWSSRGGRLARFGADGATRDPLDLPLADPVGPLAVNRALSSRHLFVSCAGSYQARDGGIVRVDLFTGEASSILHETSEPLSPLNVKVGPLAVTNRGDIYFVAFDADWRGHLQMLGRDGTVRRVVSDINAFAAVPIDHSPRTGRLYFFDQRFENGAPQSRLNAFDVVTGDITTTPFDGAPAALRVWIRDR